MRNLPGALIILAVIGILIGLVVRVVQSASGVVRPFLLDPVFYWRGAMALLVIAIAVIVLQIRNR